MNPDPSAEKAAAKKVGAIVLVAVLVVSLGVWGLAYDMGSSPARRLASCLQSGTQVFFDEGDFGKNLYGAQVTAYVSGRRILFAGHAFVKGSTLPDVNETNQYPVVAAGAYPFKRGQHFGNSTNETYQAKNIPALILNPGTGNFTAGQGLPVRTINENTSPIAGENFRLKQASRVHVHAGQSDTQRGSMACLTIAPDQAQAFFASQIGNSGTIHIKR